MKRVSLTLLALVVLIAVSFLLIFSFAPYLTNRVLLPRVLPEAISSNSDIRISQLTPYSLGGHISLGDRDVPAISIPRFELNYTPNGLLAGRLDRLMIDGATVRLILANGKIELKNFKFSSDSQSSDEPLSLATPLAIKTLLLRDCRIILEREELPEIQFALTGTTELSLEKQDGVYLLNSIDSELQLQEPLHGLVRSKLVFSDNGHNLSFDGKISGIESLPTLLSLPAGSLLSGDGTFQGSAQFSADFTSLALLDTTAEMPNLNLELGALQVASSSQHPLLVHLTGDQSSFKITIDRLVTALPHKTTTSFQAAYIPATGEINGAGEMIIDGLKEPLPIALAGAVVPDETQIELQVKGPSQQLQAGQNLIVSGPYTLTTQLRQKPDDIRLHQTMSIDSLQLPDQQLSLQKISVEFAFDPTPADTAKPTPGRVSIGTIYYQGEDIAGVSTTLFQQGESVQLKGNITSHLETPLKIGFSGISSVNRPLELSYSMEPTAVDNSSLPDVVAFPADMVFNGIIAADGELAVTDKGAAGQIHIQLADSSLESEEKNFKMAGIRADITLPELPAIRSAPSQILSIDSLSFGNLKFTAGNIIFRIEDRQTLFIEKSRFGWCKGKVEGGSMRLGLDDPEISTTLYCDRLDFSELLSQFGISDTEGDGSLNGRLPLHIDKDGMFFDDGFLFSTPGNSGIVRFNNTEILRQGMPDMGKAAYLEYSLKAMENFSYNWTKLTFNSQNEDLLISMQIDGKPATPLPYGYRQGQLVQFDDGPGLQHPIRLDVNFHLPLAEMFKYGQNLQQIMENLQ